MEHILITLTAAVAKKVKSRTPTKESGQTTVSMVLENRFTLALENIMVSGKKVFVTVKV